MQLRKTIRKSELTWLRFFFFLLLRVKWRKETADKVTTTTTTISEWEAKEALKTNRGEWRRRSPNLLLRLLRNRIDEVEAEVAGGWLRRVWLQPRKWVRGGERERGEVNRRERLWWWWWWLKQNLLSSMDEDEERERERRMKH
jgi:hypothetical protein